MIDARELSLTDGLPQSLIEVVHTIGLAATLSLVRHAGGTRVYVPVEHDDGHVISSWIGTASAKLLVDRFGGDLLIVPRCLLAMRNVRDRQIRAQRKQGARVADLALQYRLTDRQVYTILSQRDCDSDERQHTLL